MQPLQKFGKELGIILHLGLLVRLSLFLFATRADIAVLLGYLAYYFFMGKIVNRPKYVTDLGRMIVFPIPSALGAFTGYKISYYLIQLLS